MTSDGLLVVQYLFTQIWSLFTSWNIPGTGVTPAAFFLFLLSAGVGLRIISHIFTQSPDTNLSGHISTISRSDKK